MTKAEINKLNEQMDALSTENETLLAQVSALTNTNTALIAEKETLTAELDALKTELEKAKEATKAAEKDNPNAALKVKGTFKSSDGETYEFKKGFLKIRWNGEVVNTESALQDKDLMQELVSIGFGGLQKVKK